MIDLDGIWTTNYRGTTFVLDHNGRLHPTQRTDPMDTRQPERTIDRIIREELEALKQRRNDHHKEHTA